VAGDEDGTPADNQPAPAQKPGVTVDEQLTKALDLLKSKAA
jgi:carboxyl-terminal processing protease